MLGQDSALVGQFLPRAGRACVFRQPPDASYMHDGEELSGGVKYLLRTDVMYRRQHDAICIDDDDDGNSDSEAVASEL